MQQHNNLSFCSYSILHIDRGIVSPLPTLRDNKVPGQAGDVTLNITNHDSDVQILDEAYQLTYPFFSYLQITSSGCPDLLDIDTH